MKTVGFKCCTVAASIMAAGALFGARNVTENVTLDADTDWSDLGMVTIAQGVTVDLNGHILKVKGFTCSGSIIDGTAIPGYWTLHDIESSGTQWINTGFTTTDETAIEMDFTTLYDKNNHAYFCGDWVRSGHLLVAKPFDNGVAFCFFGSNISIGSFFENRHLKVKTFPGGNKTVILSDGDTGAEIGSSKDTLAHSGTGEMTIFAASDKGEYASSFRLHGFKLTHKGKLVRDMVPVKRAADGAVGLYDRVTKAFFGNGGSGEFDGGDVTGGRIVVDSSAGTSYSIGGTCNVPVILEDPAFSSSALKVLNVVPEKPLRYEKRNGRLEVRSLITLSAAPEGAVSFALDGKPLACEAGPTPKTLCAWLPFVGGESRLDVIQDGRVAASFRMSAPIDGDWGYFANGEICLIQSSHQDIAYMDTPDYCRRDRIENIIKPALEMMNKDPAFMFEMEQTLNLMEFLEAYPKRKDEVMRRYREGRFFWGATFNQPYEGLASGEQLARQAYFGRKWIKDNLPGCDEHTAVNMDVPGRASQMPQILAKSGIGNLFISRFGEGYYRWDSPDGSGVLTYSPGNYGWAKFRWRLFEGDVIFAFRKMRARLKLWDEYYRRRGIPPRYAVVISCDAKKPSSYTGLINEWNAIAEASGLPMPRVRYACSDTFLSEMAAAKPHLDEVSGERPNLWLYIHGPAHYEQTLDKRRAAISLPAAEAISAVNAIMRGRSYPYDALSRGWMASIYPDHGLGGKNGDITDRIFGEYLAEARKIGDGVLESGLDAFAADVAGEKGDVVVFNTFAQPRTALASVPCPAAPVQVLDASGEAVPCQRSGQRVHFLASVPGFGYARYRIVPSGDSAAASPTVECGRNFCSNRYYDVTFGPGGITRLFDRELGREIAQNEKYAFGDIYEATYSGNGAGEFVRIKDLDDGTGRSLSAYGENWRLKESGPLFAVFENNVKTRFATIVQRVTVHHAVKKIDFDVELRNFTGEHNRQYRIMFPVAMERCEADIRYEMPAVVSRVGHDEIKRIPMGGSSRGSYVHHPADSHPREIQNFITANGGGFGCTLSSCVSVADWIDPSHEIASYVVLQGVLLSSHKSCNRKGNWYEQRGTHKYHFSLMTHGEGWKSGYLHGTGENHAFRAVRKKSDGGALPPSQSLLAVSDPFTSVMAFKLADDRSGAVILRLVEMEGIDKTVTVKLPFKVSRVVRCSIIEEEQDGPVEVNGDTLTMRLGHHEIETVKLVPADPKKR